MDKKEFLGCVGVIIFTIVGIVIVGILMALPTMWLWNAIVPDITKDAVTPIGFWQALGLNVLCGILFKTSSVSSNRKE